MTDYQPGVCSHRECETHSGEELLCDRHELQMRMLASSFSGLADAGAGGERVPATLTATRFTTDASGAPLGVETVLPRIEVSMQFWLDRDWDGSEPVYDVAPDAQYDPETGEELL